MDESLRQRIMTAVILVALLVPLILFASPDIFAVVMIPVFGVAFYEWARLAGLRGTLLKTVYTISSLLLLVGLCFFIRMPQQGSVSPPDFYTRLELLFVSSGLLWVLAFFWVLTYPASTRFWKSLSAMLILGWLFILPTWVGLVYLKQARVDGALIFLAILVIAIADIGAFFSGRHWGRHKLAIRVSPGKSWEGFWGGFIANLIFAALLAVFLGLELSQAVLLMLVLGFVSMASVVGDLTESMFKREAGVKDSGSLLPGHGGVLDRIDGWTASIPIISLAHLLFVQPGAL